jgi:hypothetical protein
MTQNALVIVHDLRTGARTVLPRDGVKLGLQRLALARRPLGRRRHGRPSAVHAVGPRRRDLRSRLARPDAAGRRQRRQPRELRFSPDSRHLLVPMAAHYLATYDLQTGRRPELRPHAGYTRRAAFSPDGALIASVGGDIGVQVCGTRPAPASAPAHRRARADDRRPVLARRPHLAASATTRGCSCGRTP